MNVEFFGYRGWTEQIKQNLMDYKTDKWRISYDDPEVSLYYGWSDMIPKVIYQDHLCLILHPSPLPKYRGGSPLQHQIINGETMSAVTIAKVTDRLDAGDIYSQSPLSLEGSLDDIFKRMTDIGTRDTIKVLNAIASGTMQPIPQDESEATTYKRRTPSESEITLEDLQTKPAAELFNFIRALQPPYPLPFITCADGSKLYLTGSRWTK